MDPVDDNGHRVNEGSKGVLLGAGEPIRELPREFRGDLPSGVRRVEVFCGGCLVVETDVADAADVSRLPREDAFANWPLLVLVDDAGQAARSAFNFLWVTFTRFDPARDLHGSSVELRGLHPSFSAPILLDARLKPGFPEIGRAHV